MHEHTSELVELTSDSEQISRLQEELRRSKSAITKKIAAMMLRCHIDIGEVRQAYRAEAQALRPTTGRYKKRPDKFHDPISGSTWSGVGRVPRWLKAYEDAGRSKDEFRVSRAMAS